MKLKPTPPKIDLYDDPYLYPRTFALQAILEEPGHRLHWTEHLNDFGHVVALTEQGNSTESFLALTRRETRECFLAGRLLAKDLIPELPFVVAPTCNEAILKLEGRIGLVKCHEVKVFLKPLLQAISAAVATGIKLEDVPSLYYPLYEHELKKRPKRRTVAA